MRSRVPVLRASAESPRRRDPPKVDVQANGARVGAWAHDDPPIAESCVGVIGLAVASSLEKPPTHRRWTADGRKANSIYELVGELAATAWGRREHP